MDFGRGPEREIHLWFSAVRQPRRLVSRTSIVDVVHEGEASNPCESERQG